MPEKPDQTGVTLFLHCNEVIPNLHPILDICYDVFTRSRTDTGNLFKNYSKRTDIIFVVSDVGNIM